MKLKTHSSLTDMRYETLMVGNSRTHKAFQGSSFVFLGFPLYLGNEMNMKFSVLKMLCLQSLTSRFSPNVVCFVRFQNHTVAPNVVLVEKSVIIYRKGPMTAPRSSLS